MIDWVATFASALGGALVGAVLGGLIVTRKTQNLSDSSERRRMRRDVLRKLAGHRYLLTKHLKGSDGMFWVALNEIAIAYLDHEIVLDELRKFQKKAKKGSSDLFPLMKAMAESAELPAKELDPCLIENPFVPSKTEPSGSGKR